MFFYLAEGQSETFKIHLVPNDTQEGRTNLYLQSFGPQSAGHTFGGFFIPTTGSQKYDDEITITGNGKATFTGHNGALLFTVEWVRAGRDVNLFLHTYEEGAAS